MDSFTQVALGAAVGEAVLGRKVGNKAPLWGAVTALIPDMDVDDGLPGIHPGQGLLDGFKFRMHECRNAILARPTGLQFGAIDQRSTPIRLPLDYFDRLAGLMGQHTLQGQNRRGGEQPDEQSEDPIASGDLHIHIRIRF